MEHDQELLEKKKVLERRIETLERKLKDTKKELLQVEEGLQNNNNVTNYGRNMKDDTDGYGSDRNMSGGSHKTRKRKNNSDERKTDKKIRTVYGIIEKLRNRIEKE